jgi:hypothetical protein
MGLVVAMSQSVIERYDVLGVPRAFDRFALGSEV